MDGIRVGAVSQTPQGDTTFHYDDDYQDDPTATPLSVSMPLGRREHKSRVVLPFLQGLLPDRPGVLDRLSRQYHSSTHPFALLRHVGRDTAGALQFLPPGEDSPDTANHQGDVERHSAEDIDRLMGDLIKAADSWGESRAIGRWSLAGAQTKVALFRLPDGAWGTPRDATPTTHILKPAHLKALDRHDINELVTTRAAGLLGLPVADCESFVTASGHRVFVSRRYDRVRADGRWRRLHQEDLCQTMSVAPIRKYQEDGGPSANQIARLLRLEIADAAARVQAQETFFSALVFAACAGCTDSHAKNYSLLLDGPGVRLAPLYDLGTLLPHEAVDDRFKVAMAVDGEYRLRHIGLRHFLTLAKRLQIPADRAEAAVEGIRHGLAGAFAAAAADLDDPFAQTVADAVAAQAESRDW
jgi:serine/threonine-protein kinase HipA